MYPRGDGGKSNGQKTPFIEGWHDLRAKHVIFGAFHVFADVTTLEFVNLLFERFLLDK